jgi:hypothetical protein
LFQDNLKEKERIIKKFNEEFTNYIVFFYDNSYLSKKIEKKLEKMNIFYLKHFFDKEEPQIWFIKNKKLVYILKGNFSEKQFKEIYNDVYNSDFLIKKFILGSFEKKSKEIKKKAEKEAHKIIKKIEEKVNNKNKSESNNSVKLKKAVDVSMIFKIILAIFISYLLIKIGIFIIQAFMDLYNKGKEIEFIKKLSSQVDELIKKESGSFLVDKINVPSSKVLLICFTYSEQTANLFNKKYKFSKISLEGFERNQDIKDLSKNDQKNVFLIYNIYSFKALKINGLQASVFGRNPLCFKPGEKYYLVNYQGVIFITKNISKFQ